jgi:hypothetical protein
MCVENKQGVALCTSGIQEREDREVLAEDLLKEE